MNRSLGFALVLLVALVALIAEFFAPTAPELSRVDYGFAPPQALHFVEQTDVQPHLRLHVLDYLTRRDPHTLTRVFEVNQDAPIDVRFFAQGETYHLWGLLRTDRRLIGPLSSDQPFYLLGADRQGRDLLSRTVYATRHTLLWGLLVALLTLVLAISTVMLLTRYGGGLNAAMRGLLQRLQVVPTWAWRLLLLLLLLYEWPLLFSVILEGGIRGGFPVTDAGYWAIGASALLFTGLVFVLHRRSVIWLTVIWTWFWMVNPSTLFRQLTRSALGADPTFDPLTPAGSLLFSCAVMALLLWPAAALTLYGEALAASPTGEPAQQHGQKVQWGQLLPYTLAVIAWAIPLELGLALAPRFGVRRLSITFGGLQQDLYNTHVWNEHPGIPTLVMAPVLIFCILLIAASKLSHPWTRTAIFFATYHARHTGEGGPVPPTHKETHSHYVYVLTMNDSSSTNCRAACCQSSCTP